MIHHLLCKVHARYKVRDNYRRRNFSKNGNGWSLFIPKTIIELLGVAPKTEQVEMQIGNNVLKIRKVDKEKN